MKTPPAALGLVGSLIALGLISAPQGGLAMADQVRRLPRVHAINRTVPIAALDADVCATACLDEREFVIEALATLPGLTARQNGRFGGSASLRVRGAPSGHTLVLIDGVPVNDASAPNGGFDFARLGSSDIARVEIYKGAEALLWGAGAGAVNIVSIPPMPGMKFRASAQAGAYQTIGGTASVSGGGSNARGRLTLHGLATGGLSKAATGTERDGFTRAGLSTSWRVGAGRAGELRLGARYASAGTAYDRFDAAAPGFVGDGDQTGESEEMVAHAGLSWRSGHMQSDILVAATSISRRDQTGGLQTFNATANGTMLRYHADIALPGGHRSLVGAGWYRSDTPGEQADTMSLFGVQEMALGGRTTLWLGARGDTGTSQGGRLGLNADIAYQVDPALVLRAGWGRGHVAPTPYQRIAFFPPATSPTGADLAVETSTNWSLGADWRGRATSVRVTAFGRGAEMQIAFRDGRYHNLNRSESSGIEISMSRALNAILRAEGAITLLSAHENSAPARDIPSLMTSARLAAEYGRFFAQLMMRHVGAHRQTAGPVAAWTRLDLTARHRLNGQAEMYVRIENVLDLSYQEVLGYGTPKLSAHIGIRLATDAGL